jgi:hypothetical protein
LGDVSLDLTIARFGRGDCGTGRLGALGQRREISGGRTFAHQAAF